MKNEPVAWIVRKDMDEVYLAKKWSYEYAEYINGEVIPLYTHPAELTDEEIWGWFKENTALTKESALIIARAILRKAQEK
jgi:hypothetical protein